MYGGSFNGNKFKSDKKEQIDCFQTVDLITAKDNDSKVGEKWHGQTIWHEIAEAFEGGKNSLDTKKEATKAFRDTHNPEYIQAHNEASKKFPASRKPIIKTETFGFLKYTRIVGYEFE